MKYLSKTFTVPVAGPGVTDEEWDRIWAPKCPRCGNPVDEGSVCESCRVDEWLICDGPNPGNLK